MKQNLVGELFVKTVLVLINRVVQHFSVGITRSLGVQTNMKSTKNTLLLLSTGIKLQIMLMEDWGYAISESTDTTSSLKGVKSQ